jgi:hypothetical protein
MKSEEIGFAKDCGRKASQFVIPAKAGIHLIIENQWIPGFVVSSAERSSPE